MESRLSVLISEEYYLRAQKVFDSASDISFTTVSADEDSMAEAVSKLKPVAVVVGPETYSGPLYEAMGENTLLARFGVGCDGIDFQQTKQQGIRVTNTPGVLESTVAELTLFLAGELLRRPSKSADELKRGNWTPYPGRELRGKKWAILGLGSIGSELCKMLSFGFGVEVTGLKQHIENEEQLRQSLGVNRLTTSLTDAVADADIVSLHLPSTPENRHIINADFFRLLKKNALFINTARGALVDEGALYDALEAGVFEAAALDVFENEPYSPVDPDKDLRELPSLFMTPHIGSNAIECTKRMAERVLFNLRHAIDGNSDQMDLVSST